MLLVCVFVKEIDIVGWLVDEFYVSIFLCCMY